MGKDVKGKKRALPEPEATPDSASSLSPAPEVEEPIPKKSKKAVTKQCPVCEEQIPVRLLEKHLDLELRRVDDILRGNDLTIQQDIAAGPSRRGAAAKARKSIHNMAPKSLTDLNTIEQSEKAVRTIKKNRKQRHGKLKEMITQDDEDNLTPIVRENEVTCPICSTVVRGDPDFIDAHVDSCVANASRLQAEEEAREMARRAHEDADAWEEVEANGETRIRVRDVTSLRGLGIQVRDRTQVDVEDDVDVDGDDEAIYGAAQFTERDVLTPDFVINAPDVEIVDVEDEDEGDAGKTLRDLVAEGKVLTRKAVLDNIDGVRREMEEVMGVGDNDRMDQAIASARKSGDKEALVAALEQKIRQLETMRISSSTSSLCRICLDPYNEPTVSTGCWHTCCRECWLRCLGTTKLCPICKRITAAVDLRRIYM